MGKDQGTRCGQEVQVNRKVTFQDLMGILSQLGFEQQSSPERIEFYDRRSKTLFPFRPHEPDERVSDFNLVMVRKILDERGLLEAREFDSLLSKAPA